VLTSVPWSAALAISGIAIAVLAGVPLGVISAVRPGTFADLFVMLGALVGISFPVFWVGLVCILLLAHEMRLFPALGASSSEDPLTQLHHLALAALVLGFSLAASIARLTRSAMLEVLEQNYVRVARAMGIAEWQIVYWLALRNALIARRKARDGGVRTVEHEGDRLPEVCVRRDPEPVELAPGHEAACHFPEREGNRSEVAERAMDFASGG